MQNIRACMNRIVEEEDVQKEIRDFNEYIYDFLKKRYNNSVKKTEETILNVLKTLETYKKSQRHLKLFCDFMNEVLTPEDISCFLLIRSLIEKELKISIFNKNTKKVLDLNFIALTKKQTKRIILRFLGEEKKSTVDKVMQKFIKDHQSSYQGDIVRIYDLMIFGVKEYKKLRENVRKQHSNNQRNTNTFSTRSYIDSCCYQTFSPFSKNHSVHEQSTFRRSPGNTEEEQALQALNDNLFHSNTKSSGSFERDSIDKTETATFSKETFNPHHTFNYQDKENFADHKESYGDDRVSSSNRGFMDQTFSVGVNGADDTSVSTSIRQQYSEVHKQGNLVVNSAISSNKGVFQVEIQHQSVYSNYQNNDPEVIKKRYDTVENLSSICFNTLKNIIKEFVVDVMSQEEIETDYDVNVIEEISGIIYHKAKILLKAITKRNKDKWFKQLMISNPNDDQHDYIEQIITKFERILGVYRSEGYIDKDRIQELSKFILSAPEMTNQISKLIAHIVASFEGVEGDDEEEDQEREVQVQPESVDREIPYEHDQTSQSDYYQERENETDPEMEPNSEVKHSGNKYNMDESFFGDNMDPFSEQGNNQYNTNDDEDDDDEEEEVHVVDIQSDKGDNESDYQYNGYLNEYEIAESGYKMSQEEREVIGSFQEMSFEDDRYDQNN